MFYFALIKAFWLTDFKHKVTDQPLQKLRWKFPELRKILCRILLAAMWWLQWSLLVCMVVSGKESWCLNFCHMWKIMHNSQRVFLCLMCVRCFFKWHVCWCEKKNKLTSLAMSVWCVCVCVSVCVCVCVCVCTCIWCKRENGWTFHC